MRKFLTLLLAGSMLAGMTVPVRADPISTAIVAGLGAIGITATVAAVNTFLISTALSLGLSFLSQALMAKPQPVSGASSTITFGGACPREICFGTVKTAGQFTYSRGIGKSNKTLYRIFTLSDWECDGLNRVWVDGEEKALTAVPAVGSEHVRYEVDGYDGRLILKFFRGTMAQVADTELLGEIAGDSNGAGMGDWTANHRGAGVCYVIQRLSYNDDLFPRGIPSIQYELRGAKLYDRRKDSTVGGSGAHRFNDPTTWEFSENPVVMDECHRRGFHRNGIRVMGIGQPAGDLVASYYVAAANACDEALTEGGNPEKRYICSAIISDDAEYRVAIDAFMQSMAGQVVESQGMFAPIAGVAQSSAGTFKESDQLVGFASKFSMQRSRTEKANTITGTYLDPAKKWEPDSFKTVTDPAWLTADNGEPLTRELQLHMVRKAYQANRIAQITAKHSRLGATFTGVFGPEYAKYAAGDWVTLEHKRGTFTMQVERRKVVGPLQFEFTLRQIASSTMSGAGQAPPIVVIPPAGPPAQAIALAGFNAVAATALTGAFGQQRPAILVTWNDPDDPGVTRVMIEYRVVGGAAPPVFVDDPTEGQTLLQADIMASTTYEVRGRPLREPNIETTWSSWVTVKTTDAYTVLTSNIATDTQRIFGQMFETSRGSGLASQRAMLEEWVAQAQQGLQFSKVIADTVATSDFGFAQVKITTDALASADQSLAALITTVEANFNGQVGLINVQLLSLANADSALAASITSLEATFNGQIGLVNAAILAEQVARSDADTALAGSITALSADLTTEISNRIAGDGSLYTSISTVAADLVTEQTTRASADSALAGSITTLDASLTTEISNRTSADSTLQGNIDSEAATRSSADGTLQGNIDTVAANLVTTNANLTAEASARAAADPAEVTARTTADATLQSNINTVSANLTSEISTRASADSALSSAVVAAQATANDATATGLWRITTGVAPGGVTARFEAGVRVTTGDAYVFAGMYIDIIGGQGRIVFAADKLAIVTGSGTFVPFMVSGSDVFINKLYVADTISNLTYDEDDEGYPTDGYQVDDDGNLKAKLGKFVDLDARGATFTRRPVYSAAPIFQNGVPLGEPAGYVADVDWSVAYHKDYLKFSGAPNSFRVLQFQIQRTPMSIYVDLMCSDNSSNTIALKSSVPLSYPALLPSAIICSDETKNMVVTALPDGTMKVDYYSGTTISNTYNLPGRWMYPLERDPLNLGGAAILAAGLGVTRRYFPYVVPACSYLKCSVLGAGGGFDESNNSKYGGPGGFVYGEIPVGPSGMVMPGDVLWIVVGEGGISSSGYRAQGFGGRGFPRNKRAGGGGLSGIFRDAVARPNAILIAPGGGAGEGGNNGGPGGAAGSGNNGVGGNNEATMTGLDYTISGGNSRAGGGGGYTGGGYGPTVGSVNCGMGGSSFIHADVDNGASYASAIDGNGYATTDAPPAAITGNATLWNLVGPNCFGSLTQAGYGKHGNTVDNTRGGDGRVWIEPVA